MASTGKKFRFVKCPDCSKKLIEYASTPVYTCNGCGKVLRAKTQNNAEESSDLLSSETDSTLDQSDICSADTVSVSSGERISLFSSNVDEERGSGTIPFASRSRRTRTRNQQDENFHANISRSMNKQVGSPLELTEQRNIVPNSNDELYESSSSFSHSIASDEDMLDRARSTIFDESSRSSTSRSSHAYYAGSISSSDGGSSIHAHDQHDLKSRRTFRQRIVDDKKENKGNLLENESMTAERYYSATMQRSDIIRDELSSRDGVNEQFGGMPLDSEDFQFISNSMESEISRSSRSSSRGSTFDLPNQVASKLLEQDRTERLMRMEKLRKQLSRFTDHSTDEKAYQRRGSDHLQQSFGDKPNRQLLPNFGNDASSWDPAWSRRSQSSINSTPRLLESELQKSNSKGSRKAAKHHCQPISGGAPFIICFNCLDLLQVPTDATISIRRSSKLRCGSCSKVVTISFPASKTVSASRSKTSHQRGPVSISEEYQPSYSKSYSSEAENMRNLRGRGRYDK